MNTTLGNSLVNFVINPFNNFTRLVLTLTIFIFVIEEAEVQEHLLTFQSKDMQNVTREAKEGLKQVFFASFNRQGLFVVIIFYAENLW